MNKMKLLRSLAGLISVSAILSIGIITFPSTTAMAQVQGSTINGMVFDSEKRGMTDVDVELLDEYSRLIGRTRTSSGRFTFRGLSPGVYRIRVIPQKFGYREQTQEAQIINVKRGAAGQSNDSIFLDFYLQPLRVSSLAESMGVTTAIFIQEIPEPAKKLYEEAVLALNKKGTDDSALIKLRKAVEIFPQYYDALHRLGEEMIKRQDFKAAIEILNKAVKINTRSAGSFYLLGYSQYVLKRFEPAIESLRQAVSWSPKSAVAYLLLGMTLRQTSKYSEAETQMLKAKELAKRRLPDVHWQLALLYANNLNRFNDAADELETFLKIQSDSRDAESIKKLIKQFRDKSAQKTN
ncbi:MAG: tetratricopeptide repeat protein [Acidobacteriota bacterium]|nr:tetratricopeptide repeat protein [Acidobacteriota bacterium]